MAFIKAHGIKIANGGFIENLVIENLATDPVVNEPGRVWFNTTEKVYKASVLDANNNIKIIAFPDKQTLLNVISGAGLNSDGTYTAPAGTNYISNATSINDATVKLDAQVKTNADNIANLNATKLNKAGDTMSGTLDMSGNAIINVPDPVNPNDAANKNYVDSKLAGLSWRDPVDTIETDSANINTTTIPVGYRVLIKGTGAGDFLNHDNQIAEWTGSAWNFITPGPNWSVFVKDVDAAYTYDDATNSWIQFAGTGTVQAGIGLSQTGNTINVNLGAGIKELPTDEVGIDYKPDGGLFTTLDGVTESTDTAAQLSIKLDGTTLSLSVNGLKVSDTVINQINTNASNIANLISEVDTIETSVGLNADGTISIPNTANYIANATNLLNAVVTLDSQIKTNETAITNLKSSINGKVFTFESTTASNTFNIIHNLNDEFVEVQVWVQDDDGIFKNDLVAVSVDDANSITVSLTESRIIRVIVRSTTPIN